MRAAWQGACDSDCGNQPGIRNDMKSDFYDDRKFCPVCQDYVSYLQSMEHSYCVQCGQQVRLFSDADWDQFHTSLQERRPKGGRPRKNSAGKESA